MYIDEFMADRVKERIRLKHEQLARLKDGHKLEIVVSVQDISKAWELSEQDKLFRDCDYQELEEQEEMAAQVLRVAAVWALLQDSELMQRGLFELLCAYGGYQDKVREFASKKFGLIDPDAELGEFRSWARKKRSERRREAIDKARVLLESEAPNRIVF